jgi:hypothetical protein
VVKTHDPRFVWGTALPDANKNYAVPQSVTVSGLSSTMGWNDALGLTSTSGSSGESSGTSYNNLTFIGRPSSKTLPTGLTVGYQYTPLQDSIALALVGFESLGKKAKIHNAGMPQPLLISRNRQVVEQDTAGSPLGWFAEPIFGEAESLMQEGSKLLLLTDGIADSPSLRRSLLERILDGDRLPAVMSLPLQEEEVEDDDRTAVLVEIAH